MFSRQLVGQVRWGRVRIGLNAISHPSQRSSKQLLYTGSVEKSDHNSGSPSQRAINFVSPEKVYSTFHVYKTRAAMAVRLIPPGFTSENGYKVLVKDGCMLLEFAVSNSGQQPASTSTSAGNINRTYNWGSKVTFALSPVELGNMLAADGMATEKGLVMWHDPAKLGKIGEPIKKLVLKKLPDGNISFNLNAGQDNISVPVTKGEFEVLTSLAQFAIPRLLGFDVVF